MMLYTSPETKGTILTQVYHLDLTRQCFSQWEVLVLRIAYERQRRIVAAETAAGIREIKKAIIFWKCKIKLKNLNKHEILFSKHTISQIIHLLQSKTLSNTIHQSLNADNITLLISNFYVCTSEQYNGNHSQSSSIGGVIKKPTTRLRNGIYYPNVISTHSQLLRPVSIPTATPLTQLRRGRRKLVLNAAVGICGLITFINRFSSEVKYRKEPSVSSFCGNREYKDVLPLINNEHNLLLSKKRSDPLTFFDILKQSYCQREYENYFVEADFYSLDFVTIPWNLHLGRLWVRRVALAELFRTSLIKVNIQRWMKYVISNKVAKRCQLKRGFHQFRLFLTAKKKKIEKTTQIIQLCYRLRQYRSLEHYWFIWKHYCTIMLHNKQQIDYASRMLQCFWKIRVIHYWRYRLSIKKLFLLRSRMIQQNQQVHIVIHQWKQFKESQQHQHVCFTYLQKRHQLYTLSYAFLSLHNSWKECVEIKALTVLQQHINCRRVLKEWYYFVQCSIDYRCAHTLMNQMYCRQLFFRWRIYISKKRNKIKHIKEYRLYHAQQVIKKWKLFVTDRYRLYQCYKTVHKAHLRYITQECVGLWKHKKSIIHILELMWSHILKLCLKRHMTYWKFYYRKDMQEFYERKQIIQKRSQFQVINYWRHYIHNQLQLRRIETATHTCQLIMYTQSIKRVIRLFGIFVHYSWNIRLRTTLWVHCQDRYFLDCIFSSLSVFQLPNFQYQVTVIMTTLGKLPSYYNDRTIRIISTNIINKLRLFFQHLENQPKNALLMHASHRKHNLQLSLRLWITKGRRCMLSKTYKLLRRRVQLIALKKLIKQWRFKVNGHKLAQKLVLKRKNLLLRVFLNNWEYQHLVHARDTLSLVTLSQRIHYRYIQLAWAKWQQELHYQQRLSISIYHYLQFKLTCGVFSCFQAWKRSTQVTNHTFALHKKKKIQVISMMWSQWLTAQSQRNILKKACECIIHAGEKQIKRQIYLYWKKFIYKDQLIQNEIMRRVMDTNNHYTRMALRYWKKIIQIKSLFEIIQRFHTYSIMRQVFHQIQLNYVHLQTVYKTCIQTLHSLNTTKGIIHWSNVRKLKSFDRYATRLIINKQCWNQLKNYFFQWLTMATNISFIRIRMFLSIIILPLTPNIIPFKLSIIKNNSSYMSLSFVTTKSSQDIVCVSKKISAVPLAQFSHLLQHKKIPKLRQFSKRLDPITTLMQTDLRHAWENGKPFPHSINNGIKSFHGRVLSDTYFIIRFIRKTLTIWKCIAIKKKQCRAILRRNFYIINWRQEQSILKHYYVYWYHKVQTVSKHRITSFYTLRTLLCCGSMARAWGLWSFQLTAIFMERQCKVDYLMNRLKLSFMNSTVRKQFFYWWKLSKRSHALGIAAEIIYHRRCLHRRLFVLSIWRQAALVHNAAHQTVLLTALHKKKQFFYVWQKKKKKQSSARFLIKTIYDILFQSKLRSVMKEWKFLVYYQKKLHDNKKQIFTYWKYWLTQQSRLKQLQLKLECNIKNNYLTKTFLLFFHFVSLKQITRDIHYMLEFRLKRICFQVLLLITNERRARHDALCQKLSLRLNYRQVKQFIKDWHRIATSSVWIKTIQIATLAGLFSAWYAATSLARRTSIICQQLLKTRRRIAFHLFLSGVIESARQAAINQSIIRLTLRYWKAATIRHINLKHIEVFLQSYVQKRKLQRDWCQWRSVFQSIQIHKGNIIKTRYQQLALRLFNVPDGTRFSTIDKFLNHRRKVMQSLVFLYFQDSVYIHTLILKRTAALKRRCFYKFICSFNDRRLYKSLQQRRGLHRWKVCVQESSAIRQWLRRERLVVLVRQAIAGRWCISIWSRQFIPTQRAMRVIRRRNAEQLLHYSLSFWRLQLRIVIFKQQRYEKNQEKIYCALQQFSSTQGISETGSGYIQSLTQQRLLQLADCRGAIQALFEALLFWKLQCN